MNRFICLCLLITAPLLACRDSLYEVVHGNTDVMEAYDAFADTLEISTRIKQGQKEKILEALEFAAIKHQEQKRKGTQLPYIIHPITVAHQILLSGPSFHQPNVIMAALLHDTVEDTGTSFEEIGERFGLRVESYVREVTDDKSLPKLTRKLKQIETAPHKSTGAAMIKLSDKLSNLNDLSRMPPEGWEQERIDQYFRWAEAVVHRLPPVNSTLKQQLERTIAFHWEQQQLKQVMTR